MAKLPQSSGGGESLLPSAPRSAERGSLEDLVAGLVDLGVNGLRLQWRNHLAGTPPVHLPRWLLLRVLAYRIQAAALGCLDKETLRVLRQPKGQTIHSLDSRPFEPRIPKTREGTTLIAGALLTREWNGKLERVMVLKEGFVWNGKSYGSPSQIAKAMTGTSWNGHRFFGLRMARSDPFAGAGHRERSNEADAPLASIGAIPESAVRRRCATSEDACVPSMTAFTTRSWMARPWGQVQSLLEEHAQHTNTVRLNSDALLAGKLFVEPSLPRAADPQGPGSRWSS